MERALPNAVVRSGWLVKRGHVVKSWKRRWGVLYRNGVLEYFKRDGSEKSKGSVLVAHCKCALVSTTVFRRPFVCLVTSVVGDELVLQLASDEERAEWMG
jgi:pleckstrin